MHERNHRRDARIIATELTKHGPWTLLVGLTIAFGFGAVIADADLWSVAVLTAISYVAIFCFSERDNALRLKLGEKRYAELNEERRPRLELRVDQTDEAHPVPGRQSTGSEP